VDGALLGITGNVKITGGSDRAGFPMRSDVMGGVKKYVLMTRGTGFRKGAGEGKKKRKLVRGNTITDEIYQVNAMLFQP
jgi:small subunit ribosomal protein S6e